MNDTCMICGEQWRVQVRTREQDSILKECDGYCDNTTRTIALLDMDSIKDEITIGNPAIYMRKVLRHEVIHAFLFESGLCNNTLTSDGWASNEEMVDWFAKQWPKINRTLENLGCLKE